jgi:hypothetical protein
MFMTLLIYQFLKSNLNLIDIALRSSPTPTLSKKFWVCACRKRPTTDFFNRLGKPCLKLRKCACGALCGPTHAPRYSAFWMYAYPSEGGGVLFHIACTGTFLLFALVRFWVRYPTIQTEVVVVFFSRLKKSWPDEQLRSCIIFVITNGLLNDAISDSDYTMSRDGMIGE